MAYKYLLNQPGGGGVAGGKAARNTPIFPHLLRRCAYKMIQVDTGEFGRWWCERFLLPDVKDDHVEIVAA